MSGAQTPVSGEDATLAATQAGPLARAEASRSDEMPERIGRFVVLQPLGRGGMGVVLAAYDPELDRKVAIKLIRSPRGGITDVANARFVREARALARLSHPNVIQVYDVGTAHERLYIAMELVDGRTLADVLASAPPWRSALDLHLAAGRGLAAAHAAGLVHRDFKPANAIVAHDGRVVVLDFGLARAATERGPQSDATAVSSSALDVSVTQAAEVVGTPAYMAPEQFVGAIATDRSDQFSFAVSLYEGLYGAPPFDRSSVHVLARAVTSGEVRTPTTRTVPRRLFAVLRRALSPYPAERWPSMDALLAELAKFTTGARRRRVGWIVGSIGLVAAAAAWLSRPAVVDACAELAARIGVHWDARAREHTSVALAASGVADERTAHVVDTIDRYAEQWSIAAQEICPAGTHADAIDAAGVRCLEQGELELARIVDALGRADERTAPFALGAVRDLPLPESCRHLAAPLDDAATRERHDVDGRLAQARTDMRVGDFESARRELEALVADLGDDGSPHLRAEIDLDLCDARERTGDAAGARDMGRTAALLAQAAGDDRMFARAAAQLAWVETERLGNVAAAAVWADVGLAAVERIGGDDRLEGRLHNALGSIELARTHHDPAIEHYRLAIAAWERHYGLDDATVIRERGNLANLLFAESRFDEARAQYDAAIASAETSMGTEHPTTLQLRANLLALRQQIGDTDAVARELPALRARMEAVLGPDHPDMLSVHFQLAALADADGRYDEALTEILRARALLAGQAETDHVRLRAVDAMRAGIEVRAGHGEDGVARAIGLLARARADQGTGVVEAVREATGDVWAVRGRDEAERWLGDAIAHARVEEGIADAPEVHVLLAELRLAADDREGAAREVAWVIEHAETPDEACSRLAHLLVEVDPTHADRCAAALAGTGDISIERWLLRGALRLARGDREGAVEDLELALAHRPATYDAAVTRARAVLPLVRALGPSARSRSLERAATTTLRAMGRRYARELGDAD